MDRALPTSGLHDSRAPFGATAPDPVSAGWATSWWRSAAAALQRCYCGLRDLVMPGKAYPIGTGFGGTAFEPQTRPAGRPTFCSYCCNNLTRSLATGDRWRRAAGSEMARIRAEKRALSRCHIINTRSAWSEPSAGLTPEFGSFDDGRSERGLEDHLRNDPTLALRMLVLDRSCKPDAQPTTFPHQGSIEARASGRVPSFRMANTILWHSRGRHIDEASADERIGIWDCSPQKTQTSGRRTAPKLRQPAALVARDRRM